LMTKGEGKDGFEKLDEILRPFVSYVPHSCKVTETEESRWLNDFNVIRTLRRSINRILLQKDDDDQKDKGKRRNKDEEEEEEDDDDEDHAVHFLVAAKLALNHSNRSYDLENSRLHPLETDSTGRVRLMSIYDVFKTKSSTFPDFETYLSCLRASKANSKAVKIPHPFSFACEAIDQRLQVIQYRTESKTMRKEDKKEKIALDLACRTILRLVAKLTEKEEEEEEEDEDDDDEVMHFKWMGVEFSTRLFPCSSGTGIFPVFSMINHSCRPNCIATFATQSPALSILVFPSGDDESSSCCKEGEELTISYIDSESLSKPFRERRKVLQAMFGFTCQCKQCKVEECAEEQTHNHQRRKKIKVK
jgi:hypothetical protein